MRSSLTLLALVLGAPAVFAQPQSITTLFAGGNGGSPGWGHFLDVTVQNPAGLRIVAFDVDASVAATVPFTLDVYITPSTYVGKDGTPGAWTKVATGAALSAGPSTPTAVDTSDFLLAPGAYGVAIYYNDTGMSYTDGNGSNQSYANADIALQLGRVRTALFGGFTYEPRVWNGTLHYDRQSDASYGALGAGCAGSNGVPTLAPAPGSLPKLGTTLTLAVTSMPSAGGIASMLLGLGKQTWSGQPLPFDASVIGMTGCKLQVDFVLALGLPNVGGSGAFSLPIPLDLSLLGKPLLNQALVLDAGANPAGATLSNAGEGQIGQ